ncbi:MAG: toprim domain-containing protein [Chloroflexi bacterium]|nr:toprim domain-containing protein [Chloroflexota bacterium]
MEDILSAAEEILGTAVRVERHRDWAIFWCPFHNDASREGQGGHPNFGVHLVKGYWKCLRCGATGGSLNTLRKKLGQDWKPTVSVMTPRRPPGPPTHRSCREHDGARRQVQMLDEAMSEARSCVQRSPAWAYLSQRGVLPYTALVYGLGYGISVPRVHREIIQAARQSMMVRRDGIWLWAGGVVYADPPTQPTVMNVRYIPEEQLPKGTRSFKPEKNHKTWGNRVQPLGSWRITQATRTVIVLEGLFDMLITAQKLHQLGRDADTVAVYTNGASPSAKIHRWFSEHGDYEYVLLRDPDKAGVEWAQTVSASIRGGGAKVRTLKPPDHLDPDEAILNGWWLSAI